MAMSSVTSALDTGVRAGSIVGANGPAAGDFLIEGGAVFVLPRYCASLINNEELQEFRGY